MPKPILSQQKSKYGTLNASLTATSTKQTQRIQGEDKINIDCLLRKKRSKEYIAVLSKLDAGGHIDNRGIVDEIISAISKEFEDLTVNENMLGIVAQCYLGDPYEVHILDIKGEIIEHYEKNRFLPKGLEKVRVLAIRGGYAFIEVYKDHCVAVNFDGQVSIIKC